MIDPESLKLDPYNTLAKIPSQTLNSMQQSGVLDSFLNQMTPTEIANLFPSYYKDALPNVSGFESPSGSGGGMGGGGMPNIGGGSGGSGKGGGSSASPKQNEKPTVGQNFLDVAQKQGLVKKIPGQSADGAGFGNKEEVVKSVYNSYIAAGLSHKQATAFTAEVGRENGYNKDLMFGTHTDLNGETNIGMISMQKDRRVKLIKHLRDKGFIDENGKMIQSQEALNEQAKYQIQEIKTSYPKTAKEFLSNPDISKEDAARILGDDYIRWARHGNSKIGFSKQDAARHENIRDSYYEKTEKLVKKSTTGGPGQPVERFRQTDTNKPIAVFLGGMGSAGAAAIPLGLGQAMGNPISKHSEEAKKNGYTVIDGTTVGGYTSDNIKKLGDQIIEARKNGQQVNITGHSAGGHGAVDLARYLEQHGVTDGVTINAIDPANGMSVIPEVPSNVTNYNAVYSGEFHATLSRNPKFANPNTKATSIETNQSHVGVMSGPEALSVINKGLYEDVEATEVEQITGVPASESLIETIKEQFGEEVVNDPAVARALKGGGYDWSEFNNSMSSDPEQRTEIIKNLQTVFQGVEGVGSKTAREIESAAQGKYNKDGIYFAPVEMGNDEATRNNPIDPALEAKLSEAVGAVYGPGYKAVVYSGGEPTSGNKVSDSGRHDTVVDKDGNIIGGQAADVYVINEKTGEYVPRDEQTKLAQYWQNKGYGGTGLGMNKGGIHLDQVQRGEVTGENISHRVWAYGQDGGSQKYLTDTEREAIISARSKDFDITSIIKQDSKIAMATPLEDAVAGEERYRSITEAPTPDGASATPPPDSHSHGDAQLHSSPTATAKEGAQAKAIQAGSLSGSVAMPQSVTEAPKPQEAKAAQTNNASDSQQAQPMNLKSSQSPTPSSKGSGTSTDWMGSSKGSGRESNSAKRAYRNAKLGGITDTNRHGSKAEISSLFE